MKIDPVVLAVEVRRLIEQDIIERLIEKLERDPEFKAEIAALLPAVP